MAPNGAHLSADLVDLLAGSQAPRQYAFRATTTALAEAIGKIEKVVGIVNVVRNGCVAVVLHAGDAVYKVMRIQTGSSSSCGISFPDGTALNLTRANTRMARSTHHSYDPSGTSNSALFSLVNRGRLLLSPLKSLTPAICKSQRPWPPWAFRGTAGWSGHQLPVISSTLETCTATALAHDPGVNTFGRYMLLKHDLDGNPTSTPAAILLSSISQAASMS